MATPVFFPGEYYGQRSLASYSPGVCKEWEMTEQLTYKQARGGRKTPRKLETHLQLVPSPAPAGPGSGSVEVK